MLYDLIIIGGGPAGMSAGIYAARKKLKTLLVAKNLGGQPAEAWEIKNYLGFSSIRGSELIQNFITHLKRFKDDIEIREGESAIVTEQIVKKKSKKAGSPTSGAPEVGLPAYQVTTDKYKYQTKTIIIASGVVPRKLEIPGEEKFIGRGVALCATCDAPLFRDKKVAVVGSGNAGLDAAIQLTKYASKIYLLNKYPDLIKGDPVYAEQIKSSPLITVLNNAIPKEIKGDKFVNALVWENKETKSVEEIAVDGVFVEIGSTPGLHFIKHLVKYNEKNEIIIDPKTNATSALGIFAAGDVTDIPYKQIIIAAGEGAKAALSAYQYLTKINK